MKKLSTILLMLFMGVSSANAANENSSNRFENNHDDGKRFGNNYDDGKRFENDDGKSVDPLRGDLREALQGGLTIEEIIANYAGANSPYAITEVIGALTEIAGPNYYEDILRQTGFYAPSFTPVIQEVISLYRADLAQGGVPGALPVDPTAAFDATAAGITEQTIANANTLITNFNSIQLGNSVSGNLQGVSGG